MFTVNQKLQMAMRNDGRDDGAGAGGKDDEAAAQAAADAMDKLLSPLLKPIMQVADQLHKVHGAFQQNLFQICRKADVLAVAISYFDWIEAKTCEHFAIRDNGGAKAWDELTKEARANIRRDYTMATVDGLSSWNTVRSRLLKGYDIQVKLGTEKKTVGALDPQDKKYAGEDGAKVWLKEIDSIQVKAIADYNAAIKAAADAKIAEANKAKNNASSEEGSGDDNRMIRGAGGVEFSLPEVVQARWLQIVSVLHEAIKVKSTSAEATANFHVLVAGELGRCVHNITTLITAEADRVRAAASSAGKPKMTKEQARETLQLRRKVLAQAAVSEDDVETNDEAAIRSQAIAAGRADDLEELDEAIGA